MGALGTKFRSKWEDPYRRFHQILKKDIWETGDKDRNKATEFAYYVLRILSLVKTGFIRNNVFVRSAALCYSSLLALGPLAAILLLAAGIIIDQVDQAKILTLINDFVIYMAPPLQEYFESTGNLINEDLMSGLNGFIQSAKSGTFGIIGLLLLAMIAIQLFIAIEKAFNDIWGVHRGRSFMNRINSYLTFILGVALIFTSVAIYSAGTYAQMVAGLPLGEHILRLIQWLAPLLSFFLILILLTSFYSFIPNTQVYFLPALSGAVIVSVLLVLNKELSFLYVKYVVKQESLYGSLGIIPILMMALYIFWVFVLIGGQITYAIQNANFLANQQAWENTSRSTREVLSLAALILVTRRFKACKEAFSATELSRKLRVPGQILNESLANLVDMKFITALGSEEGKGGASKRYQPAKPLSKISLYQFKQALDNYGNSEGKELILGVDPLIREYSEKVEKNIRNDWETKSLEDLLETGAA